MAIAQLAEWLKSGQPYEAGVALFKEHSNNNALLIIFEGGENSYSTKRLYAELQAIHQSLGSGAAKDQKVDKKRTAELPKDLVQVHKSSLNAYKNMAALHQQLENEMPEEDRLKLALSILDIDQQVQEGFQSVDYFKETGARIKKAEPRTKRGKDVQRMTQVELAMALKNIPTYITKVKKRIEKGDLKPGRLEKLQHQLSDYELDLEYVKKKLESK